MMQNMMRAKPTAFVPFVSGMKARFMTSNNAKLFTTNKGRLFRTNEGVSAVQEFENYLKNAKPVREMKWSDALMKAAKDHVLDTGPSGKTGHTGVDGSTMSKRINKYMKWEATIGENIMYSSKSPLQVLVDLAIDDGVPSRGHRVNIFKPQFAYVGCYTGPHKTYVTQTVFDFSGTYDQAYSYTGPTLPIP